MAKALIPITEQNEKNIKNFIGMCRLNKLEMSGEPSFTFNDHREGVGVIKFDIYFVNNGIVDPCWNLTVRTDTEIRFHDDVPSKNGEMYCYIDAYRVEQGSLDFIHKDSKFSVFAY